MASVQAVRHERVATSHGVELACESIGSGPPIVFIHGALMSDTFRLLVAEPALSTFRRITYHRRGYGESTRITRGATIEQQAADCAALLRHLGVSRAHVVGHSLGGSIALQLALDASELVQTLVVLEPGLFVGATRAGYQAALADNQRRFRELGAEVMVDEFFRPRLGADWRARFDRVDPGLVAQAIANAAAFFDHEIVGASTWTFDEEHLRRVSQPVLAVLGSASDALWDRFGETHRVLLRELPHVQGLVLLGATHALQLDNPRDLAAAIADFIG